MDKTIERKIAKIVKSELDSKNYEDTAWLKAFREAGGDDKQERASYVEIRTADLNDEYYEESNRLEEENANIKLNTMYIRTLVCRQKLIDIYFARRNLNKNQKIN